MWTCQSGSYSDRHLRFPLWKKRNQIFSNALKNNATVAKECGTRQKFASAVSQGLMCIQVETPRQDRYAAIQRTLQIFGYYAGCSVSSIQRPFAGSVRELNYHWKDKGQVCLNARQRNVRGSARMGFETKGIQDCQITREIFCCLPIAYLFNISIPGCRKHEISYWKAHWSDKDTIVSVDFVGKCSEENCCGLRLKIYKYFRTNRIRQLMAVLLVYGDFHQQVYLCGFDDWV